MYIRYFALLLLAPLGCSSVSAPRPQARAAGDRALAASTARRVRQSAPQPVVSHSRPAPAVTSTPRGPVYRRWALVVGVSRYDDDRIPDLDYAASDAQAFRDWLISADGGGYSPQRVRLLLDEDATKEAFYSSLVDWLGQTVSEDMVTIYFAGHGSAESPNKLTNHYLLTSDTDYDRVAGKALAIHELETALERYIPAQKVLLLADACHSGGIGTSWDEELAKPRGFDIGKRSRQAVEQGLLALGNTRGVISTNVGWRDDRAVVGGGEAFGDGVAVLTGARADQLSQERSDLGHGAFTYALLAGLRGEADQDRNGRVEVGELGKFVSLRVRELTRSEQDPQLTGSFDANLPVGQ